MDKFLNLISFVLSFFLDLSNPFTWLFWGFVVIGIILMLVFIVRGVAR